MDTQQHPIDGHSWYLGKNEFVLMLKCKSSHWEIFLKIAVPRF